MKSGRRPKFTAERIAWLARELASGRTICSAAAALGVTAATVFLWLRRARDGDERFAVLIPFVPPARRVTCAMCEEAIEQSARGRPRRYCSVRCRERAGTLREIQGEYIGQRGLPIEWKQVVAQLHELRKEIANVSW